MISGIKDLFPKKKRAKTQNVFFSLLIYLILSIINYNVIIKN